MGKIIIEATLGFIVFCGIFSILWSVCKRWFAKGVPAHLKTADEIFKASDKYEEKIHKL